MEIAMTFIEHYGYVAVILLLALGIIGIPVPDETLMLFVGYLASVKILGFCPSIIVSFLGSVIGMSISYFIGNKIGYKVVEKYGKWIGLTPKRYEKVKNWFAKYGVWSVLISYFIPGVRHAAGYISGITKMTLRKYFIFCCIGAFIWSTLFISIGYFVGDKLS